MIIDSQFAITRYDGSISLPLGSSLPNSIDPGSIQASLYTKFIDNVKIIYGSQRPNGTIPVFFKNPDNTVSSSSTLTSLEPDQSYYVVSYVTNPTDGKKTIFPYSVPVLGNILSPNMDKATVSFNMEDITYLIDDACLAPLPILATVYSGEAGYAYHYTIEAQSYSGNPTVVPISGIVVNNNNKNNIIPLTVLFNDSTNVMLTINLYRDSRIVSNDSVFLICGEQVLPNPVPVTSLQSLSDSTENNTMSAQSTSSCPSPGYAKIGKPDISIVDRPKVTYLTDNDLASSIPISVSLFNAKKDNYAYGYNFIVTGDTGNPTISPSTGNIYANSYKCDATGVYTSGGLVSMLSMNGAKNVIVGVQLTDNGVTIDSDFVHLIYKQSNAHTDYTTYVSCPNIDDGNNTIDLSTQNINRTEITNTVSDLSIGRKYSYVFDSVSANWPCNIYPRSGIFYADNTTITLKNMFYFNNIIECPDCFPYSTGVAFSTNIKDKKFNVLKLSIIPENPGCESGTTKFINVYCNDCLLQPTPTPTTTPTPTPTPTPAAVTYDRSLIITSQTTSAGESNSGVTFNANIGDIFQFNTTATTDIPQVMRLIINNVQVAQVVFAYSNYVNDPFRYTSASTSKSYNGVFKSGDVILE